MAHLELVIAQSILDHDGFLGTRASVTVDAIVLALVPLAATLAFSIYQVKKRFRYGLHRNLQLALIIVTLVTVSVFEWHVRVDGWQTRAEGSPYYQDGSLFTFLYVHLCFSVTAPVLWIVVAVLAWRRFPNPPAPGDHSRTHKRWAWIATWDMVLTIVTGWIFYYLAFMAA